MENKSPAFQWYPKDILSSARVQMMSMPEECAYRRLIDYCWINGSIPSDAQKAARLVGKGCSIEAAKVALEMFIPHPADAGLLIYDRLEIEREKQKSNSEARSKAAAARWDKRGKSEKNGKSGKSADVRGKRDQADNTNGKQVKSKADANALQTDMQNDALHTSSSSSTTLSSDEEKSGGKSPPAAAPRSGVQDQSDEDYLAGKQREYPKLNVGAVFRDFVSKCGSDRYPKLKNTRRHFDKWLEKEDPPLDVPVSEKLVVPGIGELK